MIVIIISNISMNQPKSHDDIEIIIKHAFEQTTVFQFPCKIYFPCALHGGICQFKMESSATD